MVSHQLRLEFDHEDGASSLDSSYTIESDSPFFFMQLCFAS